MGWKNNKLWGFEGGVSNVFLCPALAEHTVFVVSVRNGSHLTGVPWGLRLAGHTSATHTFLVYLDTASLSAISEEMTWIIVAVWANHALGQTNKEIRECAIHLGHHLWSVVANIGLGTHPVRWFFESASIMTESHLDNNLWWKKSSS